ncbi:MAG: DPP IV N-terminal domain-containing protein [Prevotella sp.]|nr:DPP IV N-terminal domain-containing protein [Prevotella sp.]
MTKIKSLFLLALLMTSSPLTAQDQLFTLEDLNFGGMNYRRFLPKNEWHSWWGEQLMYIDAEDGGTIDTKGERKTLFTLEEINKLLEKQGEKGRIHSAMNLEYPYPDKPVVRLVGSGIHILYNFKAKKIEWTQSLAEGIVKKWNKESKALALKKADNQLYIRRDGKDKQLTTDGSREIVYGESVHRNEFGINSGLFWSNDGQKLAFYRMDQSMVTDYPQVDLFPPEATYEPDKYPMAGMTSHKVTVGVYDLNTQKTIYLQAGDPTDRYFTNISWSPDSKIIYMFELNRKQNDCRLVSYNATSGAKIAEIYRETSDKYVEPQVPIQFLPWDENKFIMQSQKDGYNHLYLMDKNGKELKQLTKGNWVITEVEGFNKKTQSIIILSNEKNPLQRNLYAVNIKTGNRLLLDRGIGVANSIQLSSSGQLAVEKFSAPDIPRIIELVNTTNGKRHELLVAEDPWNAYQQPIFENGSIKAADDTTELYFRMVKPHDFDPTKKYPTVVYVYGGPHAHNVEASWHWASRSWETYMAQKGYILFILDNRGSEDRGRDFEQATFHQLGQIEMQDQMKGIEYLHSLPYVNMDRLGVHGWSFGGFMTISLMTNYPDVFKVGVAGGPVIDWKWYEVMYGERYMGTPQDNPEGYAKSSLIDKAKNLKGKLQIITGYNDNTVVPQHCLSFLDACVKADTQPDFFAYPGEGHNMRGHASVHLHERITQYFEDYLK